MTSYYNRNCLCELTGFFSSDLFQKLICTHHGRHHPAQVDRVVPVGVVPLWVLLVLRADMEQI